MPSSTGPPAVSSGDASLHRRFSNSVRHVPLRPTGNSAMSRTDVERFARDLTADPALAAEVAKDPTLPAVVVLAAHRGYDFSADEAASFLQARKEAARKP